MFSVSQEAIDFGNNPPYLMERICSSDSFGGVHPLKLDRPPLDEEAYGRALEDIRSSWQIIQDPRSGQQFEVALANIAARKDADVDVEISTFTSSLSGNPGNAIELAMQSTLHPDHSRLYITSLGNGGSSYWNADEQAYVRRTGRFVQKDGRPLPTIAALENALQINEYTARRLTTNSAGGAYATALMVALPEGQVQRAYLKSRPNISNHPLKIAWAAGLVMQDTFGGRKYRRFTQDPWALTSERAEAAKKQLSTIYSEEAQTAIGLASDTPPGLEKIWTDLSALSKGGARYGHPAAADTARALAQQPEALLTYHFPLEDPHYNSIEDIITFLRETWQRVGSFATFNQIEALFMPGGHTDHPSFPGVRWAVEKYAFER